MGDNEAAGSTADDNQASGGDVTGTDGLLAEIQVFELQLIVLSSNSYEDKSITGM